MLILGIETSCDETAIAVVEASGDIKSPSFEVLGSSVHSQVDMHREYGGVYPNLAKREHIKNLPIVLETALKAASVEMGKIDAIAVTVGPGLEPALWTGITFAEELAKKYNKPLIPTNHMEGHIVSVLTKNTKIEFPAVALLISGGHTELVLMQNWKDKKILGQTKDDAVGEAFDKVARMLGLPYPGGPEISRLALEARDSKLESDIKFPRPMINSGDYNFSFSGLKTAVLYYLRGLRNGSGSEDSEALSERTEPISQAVAREFEDAVVDVLISKSKRAIEEFNPKTFIVGGGVIANEKIRESFENLIQEFEETTLLIPEKSLTTDNAVMIAMAGYFAYLNGEVATDTLSPKAQGNLKIG